MPIKAGKAERLWTLGFSGLNGLAHYLNSVLALKS